MASEFVAAVPQSWAGRYAASFSYWGLVIATLFFAASLTPSLLPRHFAVQGVLSGLALAVGYGVGVLGVYVWRYLELPKPKATLDRASKLITAVGVAIVVGLFLWRSCIWQNSIRELMEMEPVETAYPWRVGAIAFLTGALWVALARCLRICWHFVHRKVSAVVPRRVSYVLSTILVVFALVLIVNDLVARLAIDAADAAFLQIDKYSGQDIEQPADATASGSAESLIPWGTIGIQGKRFITTGPSKQAISEFWGKESLPPLRVYVGMRTEEEIEERAELALEELKRVGGFDRSVLVVATPTGTGWLDPGAVDTIEYLHAGDTAIVSMQYSHLPSWITIVVDPDRSRVAAHALFSAVYRHWTTLPRDSRPKLYLHGLSLGSLGSEVSADLFTIFEDPIHGGLWSGPPFPSVAWARATQARNPDSPMWLPTFRDSSMVRFTGRESCLDEGGKRWGPMRFVYLQHASDPMCFFSPTLLYRSPGWMHGQRGPDVSPYLKWFPIVTFLQTGFDLPMATSVPFGYGHNYAASSYIDSWIAVTDPADWTPDDTRRLKQRFADPDE
ncbi:MAG: alpha/beta-hydrolase family protein [Pirellulaceae bacterium]|nr:alpha/beta-hydrolase family protein [Pirellulaceae bacterium]